MERVKKLVTATNKDIISDLSKYENIEFLYPLKSFCVGYELEFDISEIDGYILVNRLLTNKELEKLRTILLNSKVKGIVFDDLGVIEIVKDLNIVKILLLSHIANNYNSINYYLDYVDSVVISNDITEEEIKEILQSSKKELVLNVFGLNMLMYSRRHLLSNYAIHHKLNCEKKIDAFINEKYFVIYENEFGTTFYAKKYYNGLRLLNSKNVLYYWYNPVFLEKDKILQVVLADNITNIENDSGFLEQKTIYKLKGDD